MNPTRSVILAMTIAFSLFLLSGKDGSSKLANAGQVVLGRRKVGTPSAVVGPDYPKVLGAWAFLFVVFVIATDIDATAEIATAFAWLLLLSIALVLGPDMIKNVTGLFNPAASATAAGGGGGGRTLAK